jgi:hypothetical protein
MGDKISGVQLFWTVVGGLIYLWASAWFGISQSQWAERVIREINKTRPAHAQIPGGGWGLGPFRRWELLIAMRQHDPRGSRRILLQFVAVMLLGLSLLGWIVRLSRAK